MKLKLTTAIEDIIEKEICAGETHLADIYNLNGAAKAINDKLSTALIVLAQKLSDNFDFGNWKYLHEKIKTIVENDMIEGSK